MEQAVTHPAELLRQVFTGNIVMETADLKRLLESPAKVACDKVRADDVVCEYVLLLRVVPVQ